MFDEVYTSKDGRTLQLADAGYLTIRDANSMLLEIIFADMVQSVEDFFQYKRDKELGRWRNPDRPDEIVYTGEQDVIWVFNETEMTESARWTRERASISEYSSHFGFITANAYYDAHPEPKSWHNAQCGEIWLLQVADIDDYVWRVQDSDGTNVFKRIDSGRLLPLNSEQIISGQRIGTADA